MPNLFDVNGEDIARTNEPKRKKNDGKTIHREIKVATYMSKSNASILPN
jgi:hypothetical protein